MSRLKVVVGGVELLGAPTGARGARGFFIGKNGLAGIDDGVPVRRERTEIPGGHGEFDLPTYRGARAVSLAGFVAASTVFELGREKSRLMGIGASGGLVRINVEHQAERFWMQGRLAATPQFTDRGHSAAPFIADFELQFVCSDPRKFGEMRRTTGAGPALNYGNFPSTPMLYAKRVSGSGGYTITAGGGAIVVTTALPVGSTHRIDMSTGSVYSGSTRLVGALSTFRPWTIPAAGSLVHAVSAGIELSVDATDTFI